jgi:hypothetical protein
VPNFVKSCYIKVSTVSRSFTNEVCAGYQTFSKCNGIAISKPGSCSWDTSNNKCIAYAATSTTTTTTTTTETGTKGAKKK